MKIYNKIKIFCITHKNIPQISKLNLIPFGIGTNSYPKNFILEKNGRNILKKNPYYGEITFHYWFWKNKLLKFKKNEWFGMCHYRRYFVKFKNRKLILKTGYQNFSKKILTIKKLQNLLQTEISNKWKNFDVILCDPVDVEVSKFSKLFKKAKLQLIKDPFLFYKKKKHNLRLHFEMYHGKFFLDTAIKLLPKKDQKKFNNYLLNKTELKGNCMFLSNNKILINKFYKSLFSWLSKCEKSFGFSKLKGYGQQRIYTFLTERYMPYWFDTYAKSTSWPWIFCDVSKLKN